MSRLLKRGFVAAAILGLGAGAALADYPEKTIEVVVPYAAGGGTDTGARLLLPELEKVLGQSMIIKNIPGAGGTVGATQFSRMKGDGYSLGFLPVGTTTTQPHLRKLTYDDNSFEPVCLTIQDPMAVAIDPDSSIQSIDELIAKAKDQTLSAGGPPPGSLPHIAQAAVANAYGVQFKYVPHEGGPAASKSILGGKLDILVDPIGSAINYGLRPLVLLDGKRHASVPDLPTIDEMGGPPLRYSIWFGLFAPAGTPAEIVKQLSDACKAATTTDAYVAAVANAKRTPRFLPHDEFKTFFKQQYQANAELMSVIGLKK